MERGKSYRVAGGYVGGVSRLCHLPHCGFGPGGVEDIMGGRWGDGNV